MKRYADDEILNLIRPLWDDCREYQRVRSDRRLEWRKRYDQEPYGNERDGWSETVASVIWDAVEGMRPGLMEIFTGDWFSVECEDRERARKNQKLLEHQLFKRSRFGAVLDDWLYDCLNNEFGPLKIYYKEDYTLERETIPRISAEEVEALKQDQGVTLLSATPVEEYFGDGGGWIGFENLKIRRKVIRHSGACVASVPCDELWISSGFRDIDSAKLVVHRRKQPLDWVLKQEKAGNFRRGTTKRIVESGKYATEEDATEVSAEIDYLDDTDGTTSVDGQIDRDEKIVVPNIDVWVNEGYCRLDLDGDGLLSPAVVIWVDDVVCQYGPNDYGRPPFRLGRAFPEPHKGTGRPLAEVLKEEQRTQTNFLRMMQDAAAQSCYKNPITQDAGIYAALMRRKPWQPINANPKAEIAWLEPPSVDDLIFKAIENNKTAVENKTPYSRMSQGSSEGNELNKTASGMSMILSTAARKEKLVARRLAWTLEDVIGDILKINAMWPPSDLDRILNEPITGDDILKDNEYRLEISVGVGPQEKMVLAQEVEQFIQFAINVGLQLGLVTFDMLVKAIKRKYELRDIAITDWIVDEKQVEGMSLQNLQQMQAQIQQSQAMTAAIVQEMRRAGLSGAQISAIVQSAAQGVGTGGGSGQGAPAPGGGRPAGPGGGGQPDFLPRDGGNQGVRAPGNGGPRPPANGGVGDLPGGRVAA